jgi:hypothetical protein
VAGEEALAVPDLAALVRYFQAEKQAGALCLALGVVALAVSIAVWRSGWVFRAIVFPLGLVGVLQVGIGATLLLRTDRQVAGLARAFEESPEEAARIELARMARVNASFRLIEIFEIVLLAAGVVLAMGFRARPVLVGVGMGLVLQAGAMLVFDVIAEQRAHVYVDWLKG